MTIANIQIIFVIKVIRNFLIDIEVLPNDFFIIILIDSLNVVNFIILAYPFPHVYSKALYPFFRYFIMLKNQILQEPVLNYLFHFHILNVIILIPKFFTYIFNSLIFKPNSIL